MQYLRRRLLIAAHVEGDIVHVPWTPCCAVTDNDPEEEAGDPVVTLTLVPCQAVHPDMHTSAVGKVTQVGVGKSLHDPLAVARGRGRVVGRIRSPSRCLGVMQMPRDLGIRGQEDGCWDQELEQQVQDQVAILPGSRGPDLDALHDEDGLTDGHVNEILIYGNGDADQDGNAPYGCCFHKERPPRRGHMDGSGSGPDGVTGDQEEAVDRDGSRCLCIDDDGNGLDEGDELAGKMTQCPVSPDQGTQGEGQAEHAHHKIRDHEEEESEKAGLTDQHGRDEEGCDHQEVG